MALHGDRQVSRSAFHGGGLAKCKVPPLIPNPVPFHSNLSASLFLSRAEPPRCLTLDLADVANEESIRLADNCLQGRVYVCNKSKQVLAI